MNETEIKNDSFYDEDGTFRPLTSSDGNIDGELSRLRNTYMESEREYFEFLLSKKDIRDLFQEYVMNYNNEELFKHAISIQNKIETGMVETKEDLEKMKNMPPEEKDKYHMKLLARSEGMMCLLLAATRDRSKMLRLVKTIDSNEMLDSNAEELEHGNNRTR